MECDRFLINLSAYLDDELEQEERQDLEAHLGACKTCREELALLEETSQLLGMLSPQEPTRDLWPAISGEFGLAPRQRREEVAGLMRLVFKRPLPAAAALLVCLIAALFGYWKVPYQPTARQPAQKALSALDAEKFLEADLTMAGSWRGLFVTARPEPRPKKEKPRGKDPSQEPGQPPVESPTGDRRTPTLLA